MLGERPPPDNEIERLADKPIAIRVKNQAPGSVVTIHLHRRDRIPNVLPRSFLTDEHGDGNFYGWMPVDLKGISASVRTPSGDEILPIEVKKLSVVELVTRLFLFNPPTIIRALRLLLVGNVRGFQSRIVRLLDSLVEPDYKDWRKAHLPHADFSENVGLNTVNVIYSIAGCGPLAEISRRSMRNQDYPNLVEISTPARRVDLNGRQSAAWVRVDAGLELDPDYITKLVGALQKDDVISAVYCDEDYYDPQSGKIRPFFKPAFNPPLAKSGWLAPDAALIRVTALPEDMDLADTPMGEILIAASKAGPIAHVPIPLLHRPEPRQLGPFKKLEPVRSTFKISVIIPTRDRADLMRRCLEGLFYKTYHVLLDVIVIDNDSSDPDTLALLEDYASRGLIRRLIMPGSFNFAKACNLGVDAAAHELILLLNNDVEPINADWLGRMGEELENENIGACGALLLFPDGYIQHGGVTLGAGSVARHSFHFRHPDGNEDFGLISQRREVSAVTAACLLTRKSLWEAIDGMNQDALTVAFNDVDYCLKLITRGKKIIWTPHAKLMHLESVSRRADDTPQKARRFAEEERYMHERWGPLLQNDPNYNPNFSLFGGDHVLDAQPRDRRYRKADPSEVLSRDR